MVLDQVLDFYPRLDPRLAQIQDQTQDSLKSKTKPKTYFKFISERGLGLSLGFQIRKKSVAEINESLGSRTSRYEIVRYFSDLIDADVV